MVGGKEKRGWKEGVGREKRKATALTHTPTHTHLHTHTQAGTDRTGEVSVGYYIRYMNMSFDAALYLDNHINVNTRDM